MAEITELQQAMTPMMMKISKALQGGMGMGGMGMDMGGMGMDMGGISPEQLQQLQQLEQLRMQDPAAFEEMMRNMYA